MTFANKFVLTLSQNVMLKSIIRKKYVIFLEDCIVFLYLFS